MLSAEQKAAVAQWFASGASLDEIQKRIKAEFSIHLTYLEVRLMVAELPQPKDPEPPVPEQQPEDESAAPAAADETSADVPPPDEAPAPGAVTLSVDAIMIPGTLASGDVTFSDGQSGKWYLDQMGRLGLGKLPEGYRPSPQDGAEFQRKLMEELRSRGMA